MVKVLLINGTGNFTSHWGATGFLKEHCEPNRPIPTKEKKMKISFHLVKTSREKVKLQHFSAIGRLNFGCLIIRRLVGVVDLQNVRQEICLIHERMHPIILRKIIGVQLSSLYLISETMTVNLILKRSFFLKKVD